MLTERARAASRGLVEPAALAAGRMGLTPTALTVIGLTLHLPVAWYLAQGRLQLGAGLLVLAAAFDGLDGTLARATNRATRAGAFLDSTLDRVAEILVFGGLMAYAASVADTALGLWCLAAVTGSLMVSYTRARSEGLGCGTKAGLFGRMERMTLLIAGLVVGLLHATVIVLALGAWLTTAVRVRDVLFNCPESES